MNVLPRDYMINNIVNKMISIVLVLIFIMMSASCSVKEDKKHENETTTTVNLANTEKTFSTNSSVVSTKEDETINTATSNNTEDILGFTFVLPEYKTKTSISNDKYSGNVYDLGNGVYAGISKYFDKSTRYPNGLIVYEYTVGTSMLSIVDYTVCETMRDYFKINEEESFTVNEQKWTDETEIEADNKTIRFTGFIYTTLFTKDKKQSSDPAKTKFVYFYSDIIKVKDEYICVWVMDTTEEHLYQTESSTILNDVLMKKV